MTPTSKRVGVEGGEEDLPESRVIRLDHFLKQTGCCFFLLVILGGWTKLQGEGANIFDNISEFLYDISAINDRIFHLTYIDRKILPVHFPSSNHFKLPLYIQCVLIKRKPGQTCPFL